MANDDMVRLAARINELTKWEFQGIPRIVTDTSDCMRIQRGNIIRLDDQDFVVEGNKYETRFGISDQPKYWVFGAIDLKTGRKKIIKAVFHEEFNVHIGVFKIRCYRSPEKEAEVLKLAEGDDRFMQGYTIKDTMGNCIRIIDFIKGRSMFQHVYDIDKSHERYFHEDLPGIFRKLLDCMKAIQFLHENDLCHGDIRNDHILIEPDTGKYRWIDFDLKQHVSDFDVWSMGNIINYVAGKGINSFHSVMKSREYSEAVKGSLSSDDGSAFYEYRIINLKKLFPYLPQKLNDILMRFSTKPTASFENMTQLIEAYGEMLEADFPVN